MKHKAKPSGSSGGSRLRLTILLATAAAFLLVPAAQAFANPTLTVNIAGTGSGEVTSVGGNRETVSEPPWWESTGFGEGSPPIECSGPAPGSGVCENEMIELGPGTYAVALFAEEVPGSEFVGWEVESGFAFAGCEGNEAAEHYEYTRCFIGSSGEEAEVIAVYEDEPGELLTVTKEGTGEGTVVSSPGGIECGSEWKCHKSFEGEVTLTASPFVGSSFTSWKGCGTVEGRKCKVTMSAAKEVKAKFSPTYNVTVKKTTGATGLGAISGVTCDASCSSATAAFLVGKAVKLTPKASKGSAFTEWSTCPGTIVETNKCEMTSAGTAEAKFSAIPKFKLTVSKTGGGQGTVKSKPSSINCGLTCSTQTSSFEQGTEVELTASVTLGKGSSFGGWSFGSGTCVGLTNPCKMPAIVGTQSVTAEFK